VIHPLDGASPALRPLLVGYAETGAAALHGYLRSVLATSRVELEHGEILAGLPSYILCYWHTWVIAGFVVILGTQADRRIVTFCHPAWPLLAWDTLGKKVGWRIVMGSSGHGGAAAVDRIIESLQQGYSTFVCPDGPSGPLHRMRRGALQMALAARVPIVPLRMECDRALRLPGWDRMCVPLPWSTLRVRVGTPIHVTEATLASAEAALLEALGT
jgi:lysophospholipid acyltransferase (LPLAT)-like uncharacterized protein